MRVVKTRVAGGLALLAIGLVGARAAPATGADGAPRIFTALPPAPVDGVTDNARLLSSEARARLEAKLSRFRDTHAFVRVYVYTLRSANGPSARTRCRSSTGGGGCGTASSTTASRPSSSSSTRRRRS